MVGVGSTRDRIVASATAEFAQYGIVGARVERIAKAARTSKERVYAHFGSEDKLYRFVAARELMAMSEAVPWIQQTCRAMPSASTITSRNTQSDFA